MNDVQWQIQETIDQLVESGVERGLQVAVYRHGDLVVDAVAGVADPVTGRPVTSDTPFYSTSTGKGVTATVAHVLAERGVFGYDTPIVELWPEFGAHGKETATVGHALTHSVGVPGVAGSGGTTAYADTASAVAIAVTKNRVTYGEFNAFNQVGEIVMKES